MAKQKEEIFMQYVCLCCNLIFIWNDVKGRTTLIKGYYCPECIKEFGFVNPEFPPKKQLSAKQVEIITKNKFKRKKGKDE